MKQCGPFSFATTIADTTTTKCTAIFNALNVAACTSIGYTITQTCAANQTVSVTDSCAGGVVEFQTTNEGPMGAVFTGNKGSTTQVDYELDLITPNCTDADDTADNKNEITNQFTLAGEATGVPINLAEPSHVEIVVDQSSNGGPVVTAEVVTTPGMASLAILQSLARQLTEQGVPGVMAMGRSVRLEQPATGNPIKAGVATSDTGINTDNRVAPENRLPVAAVTPVPGLSTWGAMLLMLLMMVVAVWMIRRTMRVARMNSGD